MVKRIILAALCLSFFVVCFSETAHSFEAIYECNEQLLQKFPNVEAIKKHFGNEAKWQEKTIPSPHDDSLELRLNSMEYPGITINTLGYFLDDEHRFFLTLVNVEKAGIVDFLGIDLGSAREDVIKKFGEPQNIDGNELNYYDESEYMVITFILEEETVIGMKLINYLD